MVIYLLIATFLFLGYFVPSKFNNIYYKLSLIILFLFIALRDIDLGGFDAENYQRFFHYQVPLFQNILDYNGQYAFGYALFNSIIKSIIDDYRFFQIVYSALSIFLLSVVIKKLKLNRAERNLFLFVYFCYGFLGNNFVILRQNIALLILWITFLMDEKNNLFKSYIGVGISWLWHKSSLVNLILFPLLNVIRKLEKSRVLIFTIILSIIFFIFSQQIFSLLIKIFLLFAGNKFDKYALGGMDTQGMNIVNLSLKWFFLLLFYINYDKIKNPHKEILLNISFVVVILSSINIGFMGRMVEYFMLSIYVIIPICHQAFTGKNKVIYLLGLYYVFMLILIRYLYTFSNGELMKYSLFF